MDLSEPVQAALIGATVTFTTAMIQLTVNARRQAAERAAGKPATRKSGNWLAIFALILASVVGGYAFSEYQTFSEREDSRMLRDEMQTRLKDIGAVTARLEKASLRSEHPLEADIRLAVERKRGAEGVAAVVNVSPCRGQRTGLSQTTAACAEADAVRVAICAVVPQSAAVTDVQLFARQDDSQVWSEARVQSGQDLQGSRFLDTHFERGREGDSKEICVAFAHWADKGRSARVLVKYAL